MDIRASVKVINAKLERHNTAGQIVASDGKRPAQVVTVRFDTDQVEEEHKVADLVELGPN